MFMLFVLKMCPNNPSFIHDGVNGNPVGGVIKRRGHSVGDTSPFGVTRELTALQKVL